jgi:hypothetical protein
MIQFEKPQNLNGKTLIDDLVAAGISIGVDGSGERAKPMIDGEGNFYLPVNEADREATQAVLDNYNG